MIDYKTNNGKLEFIISKIEDKKGEEIKILNLQTIENSVADYFVICTANSKIQAQTISDHLIKELRTFKKIKPLSVEGEANAFWILLDYGDIIVHIFQPEYRKFYNLEDLWGESIIEITK